MREQNCSICGRTIGAYMSRWVNYKDSNDSICCDMSWLKDGVEPCISDSFGNKGFNKWMQWHGPQLEMIMEGKYLKGFSYRGNLYYYYTDG